MASANGAPAAAFADHVPVDLLPQRPQGRQHRREVAVVLVEGEQLLGDQVRGREHGHLHRQDVQRVGPRQALTDVEAVGAVQQVDHDAVGAHLDQPVLGRVLDLESPLAQLLDDRVDVIGVHEEVDVVRVLGRAERPRGVPTGQCIGMADLLEGDGDALEALAQRLGGRLGHADLCTRQARSHERPRGRAPWDTCASRPSTSSAGAPRRTTGSTRDVTSRRSSGSTPTCSASRRSTATSLARSTPTSRRSPPRRWARSTTSSSPRCTAPPPSGPRRQARSSRTPRRTAWRS